ncbi:MAG: hypothetical protein RLZ04_544, partial [Actinomycetota bacterium]
MAAIPVIDLATTDAGHEIDRACRVEGFFAVPLDPALQGLRAEITDLVAAFLARPESEKQQFSMAKGGRAWRGWFPLEGELTS